MHDPQEWITRLNMSGKPLSKGQKRIAEYISCHYEKAVSMTAVMLGSAASAKARWFASPWRWATRATRKCRKSFAPWFASGSPPSSG